MDNGTEKKRCGNDDDYATRRGYLTGFTAACVGAAAAGTGAARAASMTDATRFDDVVDVTDAGADGTGGESITPVLRDIRDRYGNDTLVRFPPGEYYMAEQLRWTDFSNVGFVGEDATLVPADYHDFDGPQYRLFRMGVDYAPGRDLLFEGFAVDQTADDTGIRVLETMVRDGLEVRDVTVNGVHDSGTWGPGFFAIVDPDGSGVVERFRAPDGAVWVSETPNEGNLWRGPTGVMLSHYHEGTLELRDCALGGFPDNGLYGCTNGTVRVVGGEYENSQVASIRLAGDDCVIRDVTVRVTENPPKFSNQRGIRLDHGSGFRIENVSVDLQAPNGHAISVKNDVDDVRIEGTDVTVASRINHGIVISPGVGSAEVVDTGVAIHGGGNALQINGDGTGKVVCERVQVWGQASGRTWRHAIRCNRSGAEFRGVKVWQPGPNYRRALVLNGDDCVVYDCEFTARHHPVVVNGDDELLQGNDFSSYDGYEAVRLNDGSSDVTLKNNRLENGVLDKGSARLSMYGNDVY